MRNSSIIYHTVRRYPARHVSEMTGLAAGTRKQDSFVRTCIVWILLTLFFTVFPIILLLFLFLLSLLVTKIGFFQQGKPHVIELVLLVLPAYRVQLGQPLAPRESISVGSLVAQNMIQTTV